MGTLKNNAPERFYSKEKIIQRLKDNISLNANHVENDICYFLCASKENIQALKNRNHEVVFGRRGTGKTTLFKSFTYDIEQTENLIRDNTVCWYIDLAAITPRVWPDGFTDKEKLHFIIYKLLKSLSTFTMNLYDRIEMHLPIYQIKQAKRDIVAQILKFDDIIENGIQIESYAQGEENEICDSISNREAVYQISNDFSLSSIKSLFSAIMKSRRQRTKEVKVNFVKKINRIMDTGELSECYKKIIQYMGIKRMYICIDEFTTIDKYTTYTMQPDLAQFIKDMFFRIPQITVKIASVWNQNKMQQRQLLSSRPGIEIGEDIVISPIRLDEMFAKDETKSELFFRKMIGNAYLLDDVTVAQKKHKKEVDVLEVRKPLTDEQVLSVADMLIADLFGKTPSGFFHMICGSLGLPRVFGDTLIKSIIEMESQRATHITVGIVFDKIKDHYHSVARSKNPCVLSFFDAIENHVSRKHKRFFMVEQDVYNNFINYFEGLVQNNALIQYPSYLPPIEFRNKYKIYAIHYGHYIEVIREPDTIRGLIFPELNIDEINSNLNEYLLEVPESAYYEIYCDKCHHKYDLRNYGSDKNIQNTKECPVCKASITLWADFPHTNYR